MLDVMIAMVQFVFIVIGFELDPGRRSGTVLVSLTGNEEDESSGDEMWCDGESRLGEWFSCAVVVVESKLSLEQLSNLLLRFGSGRFGTKYSDLSPLSKIFEEWRKGESPLHKLNVVALTRRVFPHVTRSKTSTIASVFSLTTPHCLGGHHHPSCPQSPQTVPSSTP